MALGNLVLLLVTLLFPCIVLALQGSSGFTVYFDIKNGTENVYPLVDWDVGAVPYVDFSFNANIFPNTTIQVKTEFYDLNTSEVLYSSVGYGYSLEANNPNMFIPFIQTFTIPPCQVMTWNVQNRNISVRDIISFQTTSTNYTIGEHNTEVSSTSAGVLPDSYTIRAIAPQNTYFQSFITPTLQNSSNVFEVNITVESVGFGIPFTSYCLTKNTSCLCVVQDQIDADATNVSVIVYLPASTLYTFALEGATQGVRSFISFTTKEVPVPSSSTTGHHTDNVDFSLPKWAIALIVVGVILVVVISVVIALTLRKRSSYNQVM